jgi:hypothetical protein
MKARSGIDNGGRIHKIGDARSDAAREVFMTDPTAVIDDLPKITSILAAVGGLGTAAYGLVDACKAWGGGVSNAGFGFIRESVEPFLDPGGVSQAFGKADILATLRANWLNGVAKADQKAKAKSLIRLGLTPAGASRLAAAAGVDERELKACADRIHNGTDLTPQDLNILGRFDAIVSAVLDEGYERADQKYRNMSKFVAAVTAILLAAVGGALIYNGADYLTSRDFGIAILVGAVSTPFAPIAKDLSSSLAAAVKAVGSVKR